MSENNVMVTASGRGIDLDHLEVSDFRIEDIAASLSKVCRWGGHGSSFFSVAQHSALVSDMVAPEHKLWGLLHDAAEAYIGDIVAPVRAVSPWVSVMEDKILELIAERFGLSMPIPEPVIEADLDIRALEARALFDLYDAPKDDRLMPFWKWVNERHKNIPGVFLCREMNSDQAESAFLARFCVLNSEMKRIDATGAIV